MKGNLVLEFLFPKLLILHFKFEFFERCLRVIYEEYGLFIEQFINDCSLG